MIAMNRHKALFSSHPGTRLGIMHIWLPYVSSCRLNWPATTGKNNPHNQSLQESVASHLKAKLMNSGKNDSLGFVPDEVFFTYWKPLHIPPFLADLSHLHLSSFIFKPFLNYTYTPFLVYIHTFPCFKVHGIEDPRTPCTQKELKLRRHKELTPVL